MNKEQKRVPRLRFAEFGASKEWEYPNGNQLFEPIVNKDHNSNLPILAITQEHGAIPRHMIDYHISVTEKSIESYKVVEIEDFIISLRSFQGGIEYSEYKGICSPAYIIIRKKEEKINTQFFKHFFKSNKFIKEMNKNIEGSRDGKMVSYKQFSDLFLPFPCPEEQQKIADCLTSLDELITTESLKLEAYKTHKKGLMQKLFPAEGETVPEWRFPEFGDSGEWEEKTVDYIAHYENGKAHEQDIDEQGKYIVVNSKFISTNSEVKKYSNKGNLLANKGDILMVLSDVPNGKAIAKCFYVDKNNTYTVNQRVCKLTPKKTEGLFLFYLLNRNIYFLAFDDGIKQTNLKKDDILNCPIVLPNIIKEQQRIADCLTSLDALITAQTQKIDTLKIHKKGLMQGLFSATDEVDV
jgi:type I restriction enzyme S subunit